MDAATDGSTSGRRGRPHPVSFGLQRGALFLVCSLLSSSLTALSKGAAPADGLKGHASFYGDEHRGKFMANGQPFDPEAMTAASWDFPLGTRVLVTRGDRTAVVTITDRGPARRLREQGRVLDLSEAAFARLAPLSVGLIEVIVVPE